MKTHSKTLPPALQRVEKTAPLETPDNFTFSPNFSDEKPKEENKSNNNFSFNPFDSNITQNIDVSDQNSGKLREFLEALNSPVFADNSDETINSFFIKNDPCDSLEAAYKLLFKDHPSK